LPSEDQHCPGIGSGWRRVLGVLSTLLAGGSMIARAQDFTDVPLEDLKHVQVYSASMYLQESREAPASVTIVTRDQIRRFGYRTLTEILGSVRGFYITYDRNYSYVGVRGFSRPGDYNSRILLLLNGHRLNDNVYDEALVGSEFQIDVSLIDRVEIVRGPSSSLYGTSAFFAVVNVVTRQAREISGVEVAASAGGFNSYEGRATYGGPHHGVDVLLSGSIYESAGPSQLFFPAFNSPATNFGMADHADGDSAKNLFSSFKFGHFTLEAVGSMREKGIPTASFGTTFDDSRSHTEDDRGYVDLLYQRTFASQTDLTVRTFYDHANYHGVYAYTGSPDPVLNQDLDRGDWVGVSSSVTRTFWQRHKVTGGADLRVDLRADQLNYDPQPFALRLDDRRHSHEIGVFLQDEFAITHALVINAGLRCDYYQTFGATANPRLALIYSPVKKTTLKLIYGQAFRAPNNFELYYSDSVSQEANPGLHPEKIQATELVWEQDLGSRYRFIADSFLNRISSLINEESDSTNGMSVFQNLGRAQSRGLEMEVAGKTKRGIEGKISYTLQRTVDASTEVSLTNSPEHLAKAIFVVPVRQAMFLGLEGQYMSSRSTLDGPRVNGFAVANATLTSREFGGGFRIAGSIYNMFNRRYSDPVGNEIVLSQVRENGRDFRIKITRALHFKK
jgi:outer membrane receptor for ferrienterochelin and colicins